jgi:hypothetical protein
MDDSRLADLHAFRQVPRITPEVAELDGEAAAHESTAVCFSNGTMWM